MLASNTRRCRQTISAAEMAWQVWVCLRRAAARADATGASWSRAAQLAAVPWLIPWVISAAGAEAWALYIALVENPSIMQVITGCLGILHTIDHDGEWAVDAARPLAGVAGREEPGERRPVLVWAVWVRP